MKTYRGTRENGNGIVFVYVDDVPHHPLAPRTDVRNHSPTGFSWGYGGSGPAQLALAILCDYFGSGFEGKAQHYYQSFKFAKIAKLPLLQGWSMSDTEIKAWLAQQPAYHGSGWVGKIDVPEEAWEESGPEDDPRARLLAGLVINGCSIHLEAYAVDYDKDGAQRFVDSTYFESEQHAVLDVFVDGAATTAEIRGREYVLVATPYQA